ncbi:hypothetical protein HII31_03480 [Pseudocercospora fuligena]|uniref:Uncharacterized protein n=1 Tax=Pseudocercospora fuligena TaxID=685502 RepID=A0A8H6RQD6_9PEZI|nr:hypothetical protein HII31_03480 [Pseudocercospora fuligena]
MRLQRRPLLWLVVTCLVLLTLSTLRLRNLQRATSWQSVLTDNQHELPGHGKQKLHMLMPATQSSVDLCKTILTGSMLSYPAPTLLAWNGTYHDDRFMGGGSHIAKIYGVRDYLQGLDAASDDDLLLVIDAYDVWFQLPPEILISRYHAINAAANRRLAARLGNAAEVERITQSIIFGASKRCTPNQLQTVACYPIPDSPVPKDMYGSNTDTTLGRNMFSSFRPRFLCAGWMIGRVADMRRMFQRASEKTESTGVDEWDNGSLLSDLLYSGSDQSIFNTLLGEQEFQREVMRRRHLTWPQRLQGQSKVKGTRIDGVEIEDLLNPSFVHQPMEHKDGRPDEFGIGVDYFSELVQQTINSDGDLHYLRHGENVSAQLQNRHQMFDCSYKVDGTMPQDIQSSIPPVSGVKWEEVPLLTNLCFNSIPVMIHHNGAKVDRILKWEDTWMQPYASLLLDKIQGFAGSEKHSTSETPTNGAFLPDGTHLSWRELCPEQYDWELFRGTVQSHNYTPSGAAQET